MKNKTNWNVSGLILEGVSGTGKTVVFDKILKNSRFVNRSFHSSIVLSEYHTQRILEKKDRQNELTVEDNLTLLDGHVTYIDSINRYLEQMDWCEEKATDMRVPYLFERFHLTHVYQYPHMDWKKVQNIDDRLVNLNCKLVILKADSNVLGERLFGKPEKSWQNYLKRFGETEEEIVDNFAGQQKELLEIAEKSALISRIIDTSNSKTDEIVEEIMDFWGIE